MTDRFVAMLNIQHFRKRLAEEKNPREIQLLEKLLAEEDAKLANLEQSSSSEQKL